MPQPKLSRALAEAIRQMAAGMGMQQGLDLGEQEPLGMEIGTELGPGEMAPFLGGLNLGEKPPSPAMRAMRPSPPARTTPETRRQGPVMGQMDISVPRKGPSMPEMDISPKPAPGMDKFEKALGSKEPEGMPLEEIDLSTEVEEPKEAVAQTPEEKSDTELQQFKRIEPGPSEEEAEGEEATRRLGQPMPPAPKPAALAKPLGEGGEQRELPTFLKPGAQFEGEDFMDVLTDTPWRIIEKDPAIFMDLMRRLEQEGYKDLRDNIMKKMMNRPSGAPGRAGERPGEYME